MLCLCVYIHIHVHRLCHIYIPTYISGDVSNMTRFYLHVYINPPRTVVYFTSPDIFSFLINTPFYLSGSKFVSHNKSDLLASADNYKEGK